MSTTAQSKVGEPITYIDAGGNEHAAQVAANLSQPGHVNLVAFPYGQRDHISVERVPHYNEPGARKGKHWKKV